MPLHTWSSNPQYWWLFTFKKCNCLIFCESANSHTYNTVTMAISRYLLKNTGFWPYRLDLLLSIICKITTTTTTTTKNHAKQLTHNIFDDWISQKLKFISTQKPCFSSWLCCLIHVQTLRLYAVVFVWRGPLTGTARRTTSTFTFTSDNSVLIIQMNVLG